MQSEIDDKKIVELNERFLEARRANEDRAWIRFYGDNLQAIGPCWIKPSEADVYSEYLGEEKSKNYGWEEIAYDDEQELQDNCVITTEDEAIQIIG